MAYQIYNFAGVALPLYNPTQDHNVSVASTLTPAIGGVADYYGSQRRLPKITQFSVRGIYAGDLYYLITEAGVYLADESNNQLIAHDTTADLRLQLDALRGVIGTRSTLYRKRWDDSVIQWKQARLLQVRRTTATKERTVIAEIECTFDAPDAFWRSSTQTSATDNLVSGGMVALNADNPGQETVDDAIVTITASGTITSLAIACPAQGVAWTWSGSLSSGQVLLVDCGALTVRKNGIDAYSGFALGAGHTARTWLPLAASVNNLEITSDGPGTAAVTFYAQYL